MAKPKLKANYTDAADKELTQMKYRDLKIACIVRGMAFEDIVSGSYPSLASFFRENYYEKQDRGRLEAFDNRMEEELIKRGHDKQSPLVQFRLSTVLDEEENSKIRSKSLKGARVAKEKKPRRERDKVHNIFKGTKKALTYELASQGKSIEETVKEVEEKFPEAKKKSIEIWYKRALKDKKSKK